MSKCAYKEAAEQFAFIIDKMAENTFVLGRFCLYDELITEFIETKRGYAAMWLLERLIDEHRACEIQTPELIKKFDAWERKLAELQTRPTELPS